MAGHGQKKKPDAVLPVGPPSASNQTQQPAAKMGALLADWERNSMGVFITKTTSLKRNSMGCIVLGL